MLYDMNYLQYLESCYWLTVVSLQYVLRKENQILCTKITIHVQQLYTSRAPSFHIYFPLHFYCMMSQNCFWLYSIYIKTRILTVCTSCNTYMCRFEWFWYNKHIHIGITYIFPSLYDWKHNLIESCRQYTVVVFTKIVGALCGHWILFDSVL